MARTRLLHPEFFKHDGLAELSMAARLLFQGLWLLVDREGRMADHPKRIGAEVFPWDDVDVDGELWALARAGFIVRYRAGEKRFLSIPGWARWQRPHTNEKPSILPGPSDSGVTPEKFPSQHSPSDPVSVSISDPVSDPDPVPPIPPVREQAVAEVPGADARERERRQAERRAGLAAPEFVRLKAKWRETFLRETGASTYPKAAEGADAKQFNYVLAEGWPEPQLFACVEAFFADEYYRANVSAALFKSALPKLLARLSAPKPKPKARARDDFLTPEQQAERSDRDVWFSRVQGEDRAAYWREMDALRERFEGKPANGEWDKARAELDARYRARVQGEAA